MRVLKASYTIITKLDHNSVTDMMLELERFGRVSHLTEPVTSGDPLENACEFVKKYAIGLNHKTILEAVDLTVEFIVDRGVTHEGVRHRITSPMQESTRYCNYSRDKFGREIAVIDIEKHLVNPAVSLLIWFNHMIACEIAYLAMLDAGERPEIARSVLPNSLKSKLNIKANLAEWRYIFSKRAEKHAHPQMREVMIPLMNELRTRIPVVFDDIL